MSTLLPTEPIVAGDIGVAEAREGVVLSCRVRGGGLPERLWVQADPDEAPALGATGDVFLPPLLLAAMLRGAPLVIEGAVSAALLRAAPAIMEIFAEASDVIGRPMRPIPIEATARPRDARGRTAGAFFSGGIDSFYTVLRNLARYPPDDTRRLTHLILVQGFDVQLAHEHLFAEVQARLADAARSLGTRLVTLRTNVRAAVAGLPWDYAHGSGMAAVGLALAPLLHTCFIAGSNSMRKSGFWGTHPGLDPLWSTETLEFVNDGGVLGKHVKVRVLATSPVVLRALRVCWENPDGAYNCGRCEKCLRTMVILALAGVLGQVATLPTEIDPAAVARLDIAPPVVGLWGDLGRRLAAGGRHAAVVNAVDLALARTRSRGGRAQEHVLDALARIGLTRWRLERGARLLRRLTRR